MNRSVFAGLVALVALIPIQARAQIDCDLYSNYAGAEPPGYAEQCLESVGESQSAPSPAAPTDTGFKFDMRNNPGLYSYQVGDFDNQTFIANPFPAGQVGFAWDFDSTGTTLWAHNFDSGQFGTVDTTTGAFSPVTTVTLPGGQTFSGLTIDPVNDVFYATGTDGTTSTLYTLDPNTGVPTTVGNITGLLLVIDAAMNCDGELFVHDLDTDALYSVDPGTGAPTLVGGHGLAANFAQGMDFDNDDGTLYGCIYTGGGTNTYASWDTGTGAITPIDVDNPLGEWECAIPTVCLGDADIAVTKEADDASPAPGDTLVYTVTVDNLGPGDATNVVVTDTLPAGVTFVSTTGCAEDPTGVPTCSLGTITAGGQASYTISVTIDPDTLGTLTNTATATADNADPDTGNNTGAAAVGVQQSVLEIPTLGQFGLTLLALLLLTGGALLLRRRRISA